MAKLAAYALVFALLSLLLLNSAYADLLFDGPRQNMADAAYAASNIAGEAMDEAGKTWSQWVGGFLGGGNNNDANQVPATVGTAGTAGTAGGAGADPTVAGGVHV